MRLVQSDGQLRILFDVNEEAVPGAAEALDRPSREPSLPSRKEVLARLRMLQPLMSWGVIMNQLDDLVGLLSFGTISKLADAVERQRPSIFSGSYASHAE